MSKRFFLITTVIIATGIAIGAYFFVPNDARSIEASVTVAEAMGGDTTGYRRAAEIRDFAFPRDHGPHPGYKTEWWYFTGNLDAASGRHVGYQFTIFRVALTPPDDPSQPVRTAATRSDTSDWATDQFYMGHFTVSDVQDERFHTFERFSRGAAGLAGAQADPFRVWLEDWQVAHIGDAPFPARIRAAEEDVAIDLTVRPAKPFVLQGDRGLSQKGPGRGNASYYYSYTRLATAGTVVLGGDTLQVEGRSWMDREWSTSALGEDQVGWDWFALQLDDGRDIMYYQIRQQDGSPSPYTEGVLVAEDGTPTRLRRADVELDVLDRWTSPSGATYPVGWRFRIPQRNIDLTITPYFEDQELDVSVQYWEGAVRIEGTAGERSVSGSGYVEMTGYGENRAEPVS